MFWVYAIYNRDKDKIYIGQTNNWKRRLKEHNDPSCNKHRYTKSIGLGWKVIYKERVKSRKEAVAREKQLKSYRGRQFIKKFIPR